VDDSTTHAPASESPQYEAPAIDARQPVIDPLIGGKSTE
jgi:hypothetical protein